MRVITKKYTVYKYKELNKKAKEKAIDEYINFLLDVTEYENASENMKKAIDRAEELQTPWFTGSYIWDYCKEEVLWGVKNYEYLGDGTVFI